jgi:hypothetical protein
VNRHAIDLPQSELGSLDDLELELRKLPGVYAAGIEERDDILLIQLHVGGERGDQTPVPVAATRIAARHWDRPVAVELVRWRSPIGPTRPIETPTAASPVTVQSETTPEIVPEPGSHGTGRTRLLAVLAFPETDELEVHLVLEGRRTIGRAAASGGVDAAVDATIDAIVALGVPVIPTPIWTRTIDSDDPERVLVATSVELADGERLFGLASGTSQIDAAARATLDALNRRIANVL